MKLLMVGDVVSSNGTRFLREKLPSLKRALGIDITVVNGENSADGNGITPFSAEEIFSAGADVITGGNHTLRRREIYDMLDESLFVLRPANLPSAVPGRGVCIMDMGKTRVAVVNLLGNYTLSADCPFKAADEIIKSLNDEGINNIFIDLHAEATGEKRAIAFYLDGRVTAIMGTHTHIPTADCEIMQKGTAYVTDVGMTGPKNSCLGVKPECVIRSLKDKMPTRFEAANNEASRLDAVVVEFDEKTGKAINIERITVE
ncbi:MAG: TIGR00282 family metallophosphoesterase [Clostridia bacterium]|nr:TIGR00282 family metallophosphoesterase [Clostridia bacterium]